MSKDANVISVINMKGGVGKTTMTCNIALELSKMDKKVLVIDIDPQFNTTQTFINWKHNSFDEYFDLKKKYLTIAELFNSKRNKEIFLSEKNEDEESFYSQIIYGIKKNLDIVPGDLDLIVDINPNSDDEIRVFFNEAKLKEKYDYIFFDCPPTWTLLTNLAIGLSDYYLIPSKIDDFSAMGIDILLKKIQGKIRANPEKSLKCLGVIYTFLSTRDGGKQLVKKFKKDLEEVYNNYEKEVNSQIRSFDTEIKYKIPVSRESIIYEKLNKNHQDLKDDIKDITKELQRRINKFKEGESI